MSLFTKEEYNNRLKKVQKMMQEKGIELLISHDTNNMNYLTGYDAWSFYYAQCAIVHIDADEPLCFVRAQDAGGAYITTYLKNESVIVYDENYIHKWPKHPYDYLVEIIKDRKWDKLNIKKVSIFTPYSKKLNDDVLDYFKSEGFELTSNSYFDIQDDYDIGKVDQDYLYEVLSKIDLNGADALFVSCTALPVLEIIDKLEKKLNTIVLSSNQALIWDTLVKIKKNNSVEGFGKLFQVN